MFDARCKEHDQSPCKLSNLLQWKHAAAKQLLGAVLGYVVAAGPGGGPAGGPAGVLRKLLGDTLLACIKSVVGSLDLVYRAQASA